MPIGRDVRIFSDYQLSFSHLSSHALKVRCQRIPSWHPVTQWHSLGKYRNCAGIPRIRAALKAAMPCDTSMRKSFCPWITKIGVSQLPTNMSGELAKVRWATLLFFSQGAPPMSQLANHISSVVKYCIFKSKMPQWASW